MRPGRHHRARRLFPVVLVATAARVLGACSSGSSGASSGGTTHTIDIGTISDFHTRCHAAYNKQPNSSAALGLQSVMITAAAIAAVPGDVTGPALKDARTTVKAPAIVGDGTFTFDKNRLTAVHSAALEIRGDQFERIGAS